MAVSCSGLDAETMEQARIYYDELLSSTVRWYNSFHSYVYQILCIIGVLANLSIVIVLLRPLMRKNPFNLFLVAIAICDMTLMASYFAYKRIEMCHPWFFEFAWIIFTYAYAVLSVFVHSASLWMTVNMAVLRYLVLRNSASSAGSSLNSYVGSSAAILLAVLISLVGSAPNALRYQIRDNGFVSVPQSCVANGSRYAAYYHKGQQVHAYTLGQPHWWSCSWERFSFWTAGLLLKLVPCLLLTVFMTLLVRMLVEARERRLRLCQSHPPSTSQPNNTQTNATNAVSSSAVLHPSSQLLNNQPHHQSSSGTAPSSKSQAERTTAMLCAIVAVFLVTELPQGILVVAIGVQPQVRFAMHQLGNVIDLLSLLNSSVNFILYSTMSNLFRHEFLQTFGQLCPCLRSGWCRRVRAWVKSKGRRRGGEGEAGTLLQQAGRDATAGFTCRTMTMRTTTNLTTTTPSTHTTPVTVNNTLLGMLVVVEENKKLLNSVTEANNTNGDACCREAAKCATETAVQTSLY